MLKFFMEAHRFYSIAVDLDPKEKMFRKAALSVEKRLKMTKSPDSQLPTIASVAALDPKERDKVPSIVAWSRFCVDNPDRTFEVYIPRQENFPSGGSPTSEQWLNQGLYDWSTGLKDAVARLTLSVVPEAREQLQALLGQGLSGPLLMHATRQLLGGNTQISAMQNLVAALSHLGGLHVTLETGGTDGNLELMFCPQPDFLSSLAAFQTLGLLSSIRDCVMDMLTVFGNDAKMSISVLAASVTFCANIGLPKHTGGKAASPEEVVAYLAQQLRAGHTWDGGVRKYVSLQYRGTILFGSMNRLYGQVAECYKSDLWARKFITLADQEFKVSEERTYAEKGSTFLPSFRIGLMLSELGSLISLRGNQVTGPYPMEASLELSLKIADMAKSMEVPRTDGQPEYCYVQNDVAFRRKPLAMAHSAIASHLTTYEQYLRPEEFDIMAINHGLKSGIDDERDPFAIIAEHYRIAAEAELPDSEHGAIYWWGYASNMARAGNVRGDGDLSRGPYTLGDLRFAIAKAEEAERSRDVGLFGVNKQRGGSLETIAKLTANHFQSERDSFILPQVKLVESGRSLKVGNEVICPDISNYERKDTEYYTSRNDQFTDFHDTSEVDKEHGAATFEGIPSLDTLCIRELHKQGCEFAVGETDAAVIQYKWMVAAQKEAAK
jgi:hypothetical protein